MPRARDPIWDTLVELYGDVANDNERGRRNKAVQQLKQAGATPDEIRTRYERYAEVMGDALNTDTALASNWSRLTPSTESGVAAVFKAIWPNGKFSEAGWRTVLVGCTKEEIITALQTLGYSHDFPPGAIDVKKQIINQRMGEEAPLSPEAALGIARAYRMAVMNTYANDGIILPQLVREAYEVTQRQARDFNDEVFLVAYRELLANFYQTQ